ncbi:MAG: mannonate dehydratase [Anaerolineae bacterium]|nr:mannonate dehydratase [Anaerolineae bacterium]
MEIALAVRNLSDEELAYVAQLGVKQVILGGTGITEELPWDFLSLLQIKSRVESFGLQIAAIENIPEHIWHQVRVGGPERDRQLEDVLEIIRNLGRVGIPIFAYNWMPTVGVWGHWRQGQAGGGRGGAGLKSFDYELVKDAPLTEEGEISAEEIHANHVYFLKAAVPVAEEYNVKLAVHPDDPPAPVLRGIGRTMISVETYQRVLDAVPSPYNGLEFCQGTVTEFADVGGARLPEVIRHFGRQGKIFFVHFRNIRGKFPKFDEVFQDEGDVDQYEAIKAYMEVGFEGPIRPDHTPRIAGDVDGHVGMAFAVGYLRALMQAVEKCG